MENKNDDEDKIYAKLINFADYQGKTKNDLTFFECDYIIRCVDGPFEGRQYLLGDLGKEITIGSNESCNFYLKDNELSNKHCMLTYIENSFFYQLKDLNSETGTWLKLSNLEDGYEFKEDTTLRIFQHLLTITFNSEGQTMIDIIEGPSKGFSVQLEDDTSVLLGKKDTQITLEMKSTDNLIYRFTRVQGRVFVINETSEITTDGIMYRISSKDSPLIRAGDIIKIGRSSFRLLAYNWGFFTELGDRPTQEDKYCIIDDLRLFNDIIIPYYAIYDGHGGITCSQYVQKYFHKYLREYIRSKQLEKSTNFIPDLCKAIQEIIIYTDINYYETETNFSVHHGSTLVFVFFIGTLVLCCNLGDSISILWKNPDKKIYLSRDFKPKREKEESRILHKKGFITNDGRLLGTISVSRSFGDWKFKDKTKHHHLKKTSEFDEYDEYLISNRAEFRIIELDPNEDQYILLVSDGIFQHNTNDKIFQIINEYLASEKIESSNIKSIPNVVDNVRLDIINSIYAETSMKGKADNMTLILLHLQNNQS